MTGPTVGGAYPAGDSNEVPRAVSREYFYQVCPTPTVVSIRDVDIDGVYTAGADLVIETWVEKLKSMDDPCVEVEIDTPEIFGIWYEFFLRFFC
jgi:hypothetical protein